MVMTLVTKAGEVASSAISAVVTSTVQRHLGNPSDEKQRRAIEDQIRRILDRVDERALSLEVQEALRWASEIHVQGMAGPVETARASVPLRFASVSRRFRGANGLPVTLDERDLATSGDSFLVLGDPGSGKTTTLKRLTLGLFEETTVSTGNLDLSMPVVLVCREIAWTSTDLATEVIRRLGLDPTQLRSDLKLSDARALQFAAELLDRTSCFLLVDGLDEIADQVERTKLLQSLVRLHRLTNVARIVCSCRSGDAPHAEGYATAELLPLSREQITSIVDARTDPGDDFLSRVANAGINDDLLDRPLFLNQLLTVFKTTGGLPERPVDLYRQLVRLLLHDWDEERHVERRSKYADFDDEAKREFLSAFAYRLTIQGRATFGEDELVAIYGEIHEQFGLPGRQARQVVREIESHVGIVTEMANGFQFSHFTMQEYLCADYLLRRPIDKEVAGYLQRFPAVVAVTVALSSEPTLWLKECLRLRSTFRPPRLVNAFVSRLGLERPRFSADIDLGEAVLKLMALADAADVANWVRLSEIPAVRASIALTRDRFDFERRAETVALVRRQRPESGLRHRPAFNIVPLPIFKLFAASPASAKPDQ